MVSSSPRVGNSSTTSQSTRAAALRIVTWRVSRFIIIRSPSITSSSTAEPLRNVTSLINASASWAGGRHGTGVCSTFSWRSGCLSIGPLPASVTSRLGSLVGLPAEPAGSRVAPDLAVLRDTDGYALDTGSGLGLLRCGPDEEGLLLHLAQSLHELLLSGQGWHVVHGASLVLNGQAWVFLGPSHVGKSTLALEAWLQGAEVIGDDTFLLHAAEGFVEAVPKPLKVRLAQREVPARLAGSLPPAAHALAGR